DLLRLGGVREIEPRGKHALALAVPHRDRQNGCPAARPARRELVRKGRLVRALGHALHAAVRRLPDASVRALRERRPRPKCEHERDEGEGDERDEPHRIPTLRARLANRSRIGPTKEPPVSISTASRPSLKKSCRRTSRMRSISRLKWART